MDIKEQATKYVKWVGWFLYNKRMSHIFSIAYCDLSLDFIQTKEKDFQEDRFGWFMNLEESRKSEIVKAAIRKYGSTDDC